MFQKLFFSIAAAGFVLAGEAVAKDAKFINNWLVLGTFDNNEKNEGFQKAWIDEAKAVPREGQTAAGKKWLYFDDRLFSRNYDDYQDLLSYYKLKLNQSVTAKVVYAHTYVHSVAETKAVLWLGADSESQVWLNGEPVLKSTFGEWFRYSQSAQVTLKAGWNSVLVKVANIENTRLGFYLGFTNRRNLPLTDLTVSVNGPGGPLAIATGGMADARTGSMPQGWREWPYIKAKPDPAAIFPKGSEEDDEKWQLDAFLRPDADGGYFRTDRNGRRFEMRNVLNADAFTMQAQGGTPPYKWSVTGGDLPPGLSMSPDGEIVGTISADAELKNYPFVARVKDATGAIAKKDLVINVLERPNKWYEEARLSCLIHAPNFLTDSQIAEMMVMAKKQGYQVILPISYNNGELEFRWPSPFGPEGIRDTVGVYKREAEKQGLIFGMYFGNLNLEVRPKQSYKDKEQHLMLEEALRRFQPKAIWLDWPTWDGEALDALFSMVRTIDPNLVIIMNGHRNASAGDWDTISFEAWSAWGNSTWAAFPMEVPWPKKGASESWRRLSYPDPEGKPRSEYKTLEDWKAGRKFAGTAGSPTDPVLGYEKEWKEYYRAHIAMIAEGCIANMDFTLANRARRGQMMEALADSPHYESRVKMVEWASPQGMPPLYPSFTWVNPGPLDEAFWGYNVINTKRDTIYLHLQKNPRGKTGLPSDPTLTVRSLNGDVKSVTWMNQNRALPFKQNRTKTDQSLTIDLAGVTQDDIDTIFKIELTAPLAKAPAPAQMPVGNLVTGKKVRMLALDGKTPLIPSRGNLAKYGNDGDPATVAVGGGSWAWIYQVDLERVYPVKKIAVLSGDQQYATEYAILLSDDGETWQTVATVQGEGLNKRIVTEIPPTEARYIRIRALKPDGPDQIGGQMGIAELEVYE